MGVDDDIGEIANPVGKEVAPDEDDGASDGGAGMSSTTVGRRERKPLNPDLFKKAVASVRAHLAGGGEGDDPADQMLETGAAGAGDGGKPADPPPPKETPPPSSGPDPAAIAMFEQVNLRRADVEQREQRVGELEGRFRDVAERFDTSDPLDVLRDIVKYNLGDGATDDEIAEELSFYVTSMSLKLAGATIDPANTQHDMRKVKRELRQTKAEKRRTTAREAAEAERANREAKTQAAIDAVGEEFAAVVTQDPNAFSWLALADEPKRLLWQIIKREHERSGKILDVQDAARLADGHLKKETTAYFGKYKNLLQPAPAETPAPKERAPGGPPDRRSRALTNADASEDTSGSPPAQQPAAPLSKEERRARTFSKWKDKLKESES